MPDLPRAGHAPAVPARTPEADTGTTQAVTVVQPSSAPAPSPLLINVGTWAGALVAIAAALALLYKLLTRDLKRDVDDVKRDVVSITHKVRNSAGRIDGLEHLRTSDIERIVRVETSIAGIEKSIDRVDKTINDRFDMITHLIREMRTVSARG